MIQHIVFSKFGSIGFGLITALVILGVLILAFELAMFIHVIKNQAIDQNTKILWIVGMFLLHPFVALIYYFTDYTKAT